MNLRLNYLVCSLLFIVYLSGYGFSKEVSREIISLYNQKGNIIQDTVKSLKFDCSECNVELVKALRSNISNVNEDQILNFLFCLREDCFNNVEFGEFANYSLFVLMQERPDLFIKVLTNNKSKLDFKFILKIIENPVSDQIDINKCLEKIKSVQEKSEIKNTIVKSLKIALSKYK